MSLSPTGQKDNVPCTVTIVGGGNSAHILIPFLSGSGHTVNLLTRRPTQWKESVTVEFHSMDEEVLKTYEGRISKKSSDPAEVIPDADVIVLCMPVHTYRVALHRIAPHINRTKAEVFVGTIYGQAGFNWMVHEVERRFALTNVVTYAVGLIPWICRTVEYGSRAVNYGGKLVNVCAVTPSDRFDRLNEIFLEDINRRWMGDGAFVQACSFLSLTLSVDNQFIHPSRCYGLWKTDGGRWASREAVPFFYRDFDQVSSDIMMGVDADYTKVRDAVRKRFPSRPFKYMLDYLSLERLTHGSSTDVDIRKSFQESKQLGQIKTPTKQMPNGECVLDTDCRFFTDDIPYGLLIAKWIAQELDVSTPMIDEVITWAQELRNEVFLKDDTIALEECLEGKFTTGIPPSYGITSIDKILD